MPQDAVARLLKRISAGEVALSGSDREILGSVLRELKIPVESQLAVFSRTSLQGGLIRPNHPRALYFSDSAYVGWMPGGLIEAVAIDPALGPIFYAFDPQDARDGRRTFVRETSCLRCHAGPAPGGDAPRLLALSGFTGANGEPLLPQHAESVDDRTPFERRWGGWYVTGYTGKQNHHGNTFARQDQDGIDFKPSDQRPAGLAEFFDPAAYLTATSDIVALLVFEHQLTMHNSLTRAAHQVRQTSGSQPLSAGESASESVLAGAAEDVLDHLLFRNAATLPDESGGNEGSRRVFAADARRSARGDSLKDLSLHGRLLANRCSFLIYSDSFGALPAPLQDRILDRLYAVLCDADPSGRYGYLEKDEKRRILEILVATHPGARRRFQNPPQ